MRDHWDELNNHPARERAAIFGTRRFLAQLVDGEGDLLTFFGEVDWREDSEGLRVTDIRYWPDNESMRESIEEYVYMNLF